MINYKCNEQRDISGFSRLETWLNRKKGITIRKVGTIDITMKEAEILYQALGRYLGKVDFKKEMEEDKKRFLGLK